MNNIDSALNLVIKASMAAIVGCAALSWIKQVRTNDTLVIPSLMFWK